MKFLLLPILSMLLTTMVAAQDQLELELIAPAPQMLIQLEADHSLVVDLDPNNRTSGSGNYDLIYNLENDTDTICQRKGYLFKNTRKRTRYSCFTADSSYKKVFRLHLSVDKRGETDGVKIFFETDFQTNNNAMIESAIVTIKKLMLRDRAYNCSFKKISEKGNDRRAKRTGTALYTQRCFSVYDEMITINYYQNYGTGDTGNNAGVSMVFFSYPER